MKRLLEFFRFRWVGESFRVVREFDRNMDASYPKKHLFEFSFHDTQQYKDWTKEFKAIRVETMEVPDSTMDEIMNILEAFRCAFSVNHHNEIELKPIEYWIEESN